MAKFGVKPSVLRSIMLNFFNFGVAFMLVSAERSLRNGESVKESETNNNYFLKAINFLWQSDESGYHHVWPEMEFNWQIVLGSIIGFFGAAFGSVGGVGGGGIFVPMLSLIIGFDAKSATAISKCMIMGAAASTVYYNLKLRHPTLDMPIIDYDLALLIQPMLMMGISIGVTFNVLFADWMVTVLLIILFLGTSTKAFFKGVETWKKETILKKEAARRLEPNETASGDVEYKPLPSGPSSDPPKDNSDKEVGLYFGECLLERTWTPLFRLDCIPCTADYQAGVVGGLLGLGGGFIMGPLFLELGVPPQVSSATATFAMTFSSSMSVVEYYLLKRFPVPYALYFTGVATVAAFIGQHVVRKLIILFGRASLIIFILASTIFVSAISLGGVGISNMIGKIERHEYMGFENLCKYES
ncbi:hypothetical protein F383_28778 [Gossypium arboreum]|uniref:Sulfite exporter TauE/SafE family protein 3-like n=1 Tax=Gossypium arboreum TaxID=29729 RepID=A0A0B0N142_GOSAR|nr:hypothetical protein F383_28778 [Gossypium arboreum]